MSRARDIADLVDANGDIKSDALDNVLKEIAQTKAETAVDVFVYDTSKDSDGGAWRKRTQHTSWYNEALNTATRGSRKEFPAVAVIVAETNKITIYDGDDPAMPMWMVFTRVSQDPYLSGYTNGASMIGNYSVCAVSAKNGILSIGEIRTAGALSGLNAGLRVINFVSDNAIAHNDTDAYVFPSNISLRDTLVKVVATSGAIVSPNVNDVAMTVLPNAPIDPATGLPVPTIAVATDGGVSVIKDDGSVVDIKTTTESASTDGIAFLSDTQIQANRGNFSIVLDIPTSDITNTYWVLLSNYSHRFLNAVEAGSLNTVGTPTGYVKGAIKSASGLTKLAETATNPSNDMVSWITSDYNTGWMNGDIKLATLSDTDTTDLVGTELVTNGTFDSDVSGWSAVDSTLSVSSGELVVTRTASSQYPYQSFTTVAGKTYTFSTQVKNGTDTSVSTYIAVGTAVGGQSLGTTSGSPTTTNASFQTISVTFTATGTTTYIMLHSQIGADGQTVIWDNISVRLAEEDRSVNGNGLQVFGTITKEPVASGADLVAYSGFSPSNYLEQPYNPDLDFGTGDFCIMGWFKANTATFNTGLAAFNTPIVGSGWLVELRNDAKILLQTREATLSSSSFTLAQPMNTWLFYVGMVTASGTKITQYVNGKLSAGNTVAARDTTNTSAVLQLGNEPQLSDRPFDGSMALWRISATAPTAEQIAKIYEDEKVLFQENAKATLYGNSDAVTALAYDDSTELLHVGTSAGRSDFQGLRRVSNTTDAVGSAISASNGLIAED